MAASALQKILSQLKGLTNPSPGQWQACCPVHKGGNEANPSFGLTIDPDGRIKFNCFRGCSPDSIRRSLGVTPRELAPDEGVPRIHDPAEPREKHDPPEVWEQRCSTWTLLFSQTERTALANALWINEAALDHFPGIGVRLDHPNGKCWTFPERDSQGQIIGVGLRFENHKKISAAGSRRGLSIPAGWKDRPGALYLVEGPSDTLAMTAAGLAAIGRPSNVGGVKILAELIQHECPDREIIWMGENDQKPDGSWPGRDESKRSAAKLASELRRSILFALPPGPNEKDVRSWLTKLVLDGVTWAEVGQRFVSLIKTKKINPTQVTQQTLAAAGGRTIIRFNPGDDELTTNDDVIRVLAADPEMFVRGEQLVQVVYAPEETALKIKFPPAPTIQEMATATLRERVSHLTQWLTVGRFGDRQISVPEWCVTAIYSRKRWSGIRYIQSVVEYPFLRPDGSLVTEPGYDEVTGVYLYPYAIKPTIPSILDRNAAVRAWLELEEVICDFPFPHEQYKSAWLCAVLTPLARFVFDGPAPLNMVDGNTPGTGKSLLANVASLILTGKEFATVPYTHDNEEMRKKITAFVTRGTKGVLFDNVAGKFGGSALDAVLTTGLWEDRILGTSNSISFPLLASFWATGNNVQIDGDGLRRVNLIRIESLEERPEERTGFKHENLKPWILVNRSRLLGNALTILLAYFQAGRPEQKILPWGSYEEWSRIVRNAVVWLGLPDPAEGKRELRRASDPIVAAMAVILSQWEEIDPDNKGITASQIINLVFPHRPLETPERLADVAEAIGSLCHRQSSQQLGAKFRHFRGRTLDGRKLGQVSVSGKIIRWGVFDKDNRLIRFGQGDGGEKKNSPEFDHQRGENSYHSYSHSVKSEPHHPHHPQDFSDFENS